MKCYYAKQEGLKGFATETGAGQWGSAEIKAGRDIQAAIDKALTELPQVLE